MLIHDPITRDLILNQAGGVCGIFRHPITHPSQGMLDKTEKGAQVIGWMGGICYRNEVIKEISKVEFNDVFAVAKFDTSKIPDLFFTHSVDLSEADFKWANSHHKAWLTMLAWTCWENAGDHGLAVEQRAYWWGILNQMCNDIFIHRPTPSGSQTTVVLPAGLVSHKLRLAANKKGKTPWHQLNLLTPPELHWSIYTSPEVVRGVRRFLSQDPTTLMFDQEHRAKIQSVPVDPGAAPFMKNTINPTWWSVPGAIEACRKEGSDHFAKGALLEAVFEKLLATQEAHMVETDDARKTALEVAAACLLVADGEELSAETLGRLVDDKGVKAFDSERALGWVDLYNEVAGLPPL